MMSLFQLTFVDTKRFFSKRYDNCLVKRKSLSFQKVSREENTKYSNFILPKEKKNPEEIFFEETIKFLLGIFDEQGNLFHKRYQSLNIVKPENEDFVTYAGNVNSQCALFELGNLSENMFKCLIFMQGLTAAKDEFICSRILTIMEQDPEIT